MALFLCDFGNPNSGLYAHITDCLNPGHCVRLISKGRPGTIQEGLNIGLVDFLKTFPENYRRQVQGTYPRHQGRIRQVFLNKKLTFY